jgi:hypothetical protein
MPLTAQDVVRHALAAYYRAQGDATAPEGDPNPVAWSSPEEFVRTLLDFLELRVRAEACRAGHPVEADVARFDLWNGQLPWGKQHLRDVDPAQWAQLVVAGPGVLLDAGGGRSPSDKGHGCPALSPAVGPALAQLAEARDGVPSQPRDITLPAAPLFAGRRVQELPGESDRHNLNHDGENIG